MLVCVSPLCAAQCARTADPAWHAPLPPQAHQSRRPLAPAAVTSHAAAKPLRPARSPSLAHDLATRPQLRRVIHRQLLRTHCAAQARPACSSPGACVERARVHSPQLRRSRAARAAPAPLPRHSRAATAREFPCVLPAHRQGSRAWACVAACGWRVAERRERGRVRGRGRAQRDAGRMEGNAHAWNGRPAADA